ncbi:MAG: homoserine dehydrogenase [Firmicutes bacterium]|nr:homoserine dehydrogenase [Bacillota bacterium]
MKTINIAIMGIGVVGGGSYDILKANREMIAKTQGITVKVAKVLDRNKDTIVKRGVPAECAVTDIADIVSDKSISIVLETMGGVEPAKTFIKQVLQSGKSVVTANKELLAKHWPELDAVAKAAGAGLYFEASCVGGVPVIRVLEESMQANNLSEIVGIINGTTNYILTKMAEENLSYDAALKGAQSLGFAEADPTADVEGFDAIYKLSILASLGFRAAVRYEKIYREGITKVTAADIKNAERFGYTVKLLGIGKRVQGKIQARVHPCFVPRSHPLASVRNEFNAVFLKGDSVDDIMLYGRGAGSLPTGSALVSDVITCAKNAAHPYASFDLSVQNTAIASDFESAYYLALTVEDKAGVLAKIAADFSKYGVSVSQMVQNVSVEGTANLIFLTHVTQESAMQKALVEIKKTKEVKSADSLIRVL